MTRSNPFLQGQPAECGLDHCALQNRQAAEQDANLLPNQVKD